MCLTGSAHFFAWHVGTGPATCQAFFIHSLWRFRILVEFHTGENTPFYETICRSFVIDKPFCRSFQAFFDRQVILPLKTIRLIKRD